MRLEQVEYNINWKNFRTGYSFFLPCLDTRAGKEEIRRITKRLKINIFMKVVVEDGIQGLRIWRV